MPAGRPKFEITDIVCQKAKHLAAGGCTMVQIASSLGINYETLRVKKRQFTAFSAAIDEGKKNGLVAMTNALYEKGVAGDTTAMKFYLSNRDSDTWREKQHTEFSGSVGIHEDCLDDIE